jgi:site-specific DNA recombinase
VEHEGTHEHLVSKQVFFEVQAILDAHNVGEKRRVHNHYLKGSVFCGSCGSRLCITKATNRHGATYHYFFCLGRQQRRTECQQSAIPVETVEDHIEAKWRRAAIAPHYADLLATLVEQDLASSWKRAKHDRARATSRLQSLTEQRQKLLDAHYEGAIPLDLLKSEQLRIAGEMDQLEERLEATQVEYRKVVDVLHRCLQLLEDCERMCLEADHKLRRQMNQGIFEKFYIDEHGVTDTVLADPFQVLLAPDFVQLQTNESVAIEQTDETASPPSLAHIEDAWVGGVPTWLRDGEWWNAVRTKKSPARLCARDFSGSRARPKSLLRGLGLKESYLVRPEGLEPST